MNHIGYEPVRSSDQNSDLLCFYLPMLLAVSVYRQAHPNELPQHTLPALVQISVQHHQST